MQDELELPPANADEWSDQQWIDWLKATDAIGTTQGQPVPTTKAGRITHSSGGQVLGATMLGIARALYGPQADPPAIVVDAGKPDDDRPVSLHLDFERPDRSYLLLASGAGEGLVIGR